MGRRSQRVSLEEERMSRCERGLRILHTLLAFREEHDSWEATDLVLLSERPVVLGVRVDVSDEALEVTDNTVRYVLSDRRETYVGLVRECLGDLLVNGL